MKGPNLVLAAVDFSERSRVALGFAVRLSNQFDAELHIVHALDPLLAAAAEHQHVDLVGETERELTAFADATRPPCRGERHFHVIVGPPASAIAHTAERESADVIVLAAHGMSSPQHLLLGSTTEGVLRSSGVSVFVVPDDWTAAYPDTASLAGEGPVIAAVDFRIPSIEAAADGATLAAALRSELVLVHVVPTLRVLPQWHDHAEAALAGQSAEAQLELVKLRDSVSHGVPTELLVTRGRVATCIAESARRYPHAVITVGRAVYPHGLAQPGTTAYRVLTQAKLPVLMHVAR